ncbi:hypothetical protein [Paenarthrobacter sp. YIM B13468]|uniref:hypothetical protein n=1 Tax=Paenarthrobacter sp. YIM B13468 TaxID=3366295 RepID=UPI0036715FED
MVDFEGFKGLTPALGRIEVNGKAPFSPADMAAISEIGAAIGKVQLGAYATANNLGSGK